MHRTLPSLRALQAFEAASRRKSLSVAAGELNVTVAAVSQHIKYLEGWLGLALFDRSRRQMQLTRAGDRLMKDLESGFDQLAAAIENVVRQGGRRQPNSLIVTVAPSIAAKWLNHRLHRFRARHPEIDLEISVSAAVMDLSRGGIDVAIRWGRGAQPGLKAWRLMPNTLIPVCGPNLLTAPHPLRGPADLRHHTLLHDETLTAEDQRDWRKWLEGVGLRPSEIAKGLHFNHSAMAYQAAMDGCGVVLGKSALIEDDMKEGRLVNPFGITFPSIFTYFIVCSVDDAGKYAISCFRRWLLQEASGRGAGRS